MNAAFLTAPADAMGLEALEAQLRRDLDWLIIPAPSWTPALTHPETGPVLDVAVIGAGMLGLTASFALRRAGLTNILAFDRAPDGVEGPWVTYARMRTLRSPKILTGPAMGIGALSYRAWHEAQFGITAWNAMDKIPRTLWMDYLRWYRKVLDVAVQNETEVTAIADDGGLARINFRNHPSRHARKLVLATGRDGLGAPHIPDFARDLPKNRYAHTAEAIDFQALKGRDVALVGAGASAMDNAAEALEAGARSVRLFVRRPALPAINKLTGVGCPGLTMGYHKLPDLWKWRFMHYNEACQNPPPRDSVLRITKHPNCFIHLSCPVVATRAVGDKVLVTTGKGDWTGDFLILGTGFSVDLASRPELKGVAENILLWRDMFEPPAELASEFLLNHPYLGEGFALRERAEGRTPLLRHLHCFNNAAMLSQGKNSGDIPAVSDGAIRLAETIATDLFGADVEHHWRRLQDFVTPELRGDEYVGAPFPSESLAAE